MLLTYSPANLNSLAHASKIHSTLPKPDAEFGKLVHAIFGILLATCVTSGLIGIIILSTHSNIIKNAQFHVLKVFNHVMLHVHAEISISHRT